MHSCRLPEPIRKDETKAKVCRWYKRTRTHNLSQVSEKSIVLISYLNLIYNVYGQLFQLFISLINYRLSFTFKFPAKLGHKLVLRPPPSQLQFPRLSYEHVPSPLLIPTSMCGKHHHGVGKVLAKGGATSETAGQNRPLSAYVPVSSCSTPSLHRTLRRRN